MRITVIHQTVYNFDPPVAGALQELRLTPRSSPNQKVENWSIELDGATEQVRFRDQHANDVVLISIDGGARRASVRCHGTVTTSDTNGIITGRVGYAPDWLYLRTTSLTEPGHRVRDLVAGLDTSGERLDLVHGLSNSVREAVAYDVGWTHSATTAEDALGSGRGVCQDHAHVFLSACRLLGVPARYVSGYLFMDDREDQEAGHAWAEAWVEGLGWVGFDIANGISPDEKYVRIAIGLDYREAAPVSGLRFGDSEEDLEVTLRVHEQSQQQQQ